jgi:hypothetical protein
VFNELGMPIQMTRSPLSSVEFDTFLKKCIERNQFGNARLARMSVVGKICVGDALLNVNYVAQLYE